MTLGFDFDLGFDLGVLASFGLGFGLFSDLVQRYSVLKAPILVLISLSSLISSSVAGLLSGNGIVDLLYSSLSFKLMWVNLCRMYLSGQGSCLGFCIWLGLVLSNL